MIMNSRLTILGLIALTAGSACTIWAAPGAATPPMTTASATAGQPANATATAPAGRRGGGRSRGTATTEPRPLSQITIRDECILPDAATKTYYMVGPGGRGVVEYTSKDLITWSGGTQIYTPPADVWGTIRINSIWAPEIHKYKDKYYLFLTFDTNTPLPEQNPPGKPPLSQRPLVYRGSTTLVSDSITGPFKAMQDHSIPPKEMMTLDGTFWVEDGQPYMVFSREWVQCTVGEMWSIKLKDDLSTAIDKPTLLFKSSEAAWAKVQPEGGTVTDGPYLRTSKSGKLFLIWSSFDERGRYQVGISISDSGKLAGPWKHQPEALFPDDGGHPMLFETFDGKLMMVLHSPGNGNTRAHLYEMEDTGDTLKLGKEFTGKP
jgi:beta-xylosidase